MSALGPRAAGLRLIRLALVAVAVGTVINTAGMVGLFIYGSSRNADRVDQINAERAQNIERNCVDINVRHDRTIAALDEILGKRSRHVGAVERERLRASRETTVLLIESLVPKRDCSALAREQVDSK